MDDMKNIEHLKTQQDYTIEETPEVFLISWRGNDAISITKQEIETMDIPAIERRAHNGRNVRGMTRVTGYYSYVDSWNSGKRAELLQRSRTTGDLQHMEVPKQ